MSEAPELDWQDAETLPTRSARSVARAGLSVVGITLLSGIGVAALLVALAIAGGAMVERIIHPAKHALPEFRAFAAGIPGVAEVSEGWSTEAMWLESGGPSVGAVLTLEANADPQQVAETLRAWIADPARDVTVVAYLRLWANTIALTADAALNDAHFALLNTLARLDGLARATLRTNAIVLEAAGPGAALAALNDTPLDKLHAGYGPSTILALSGPQRAPGAATDDYSRYTYECADGASCARIQAFDADTAIPVAFLHALDAAPELDRYSYSCSQNCPLDVTLRPDASLTDLSDRLAAFPEFDALADFRIDAAALPSG